MMAVAHAMVGITLNLLAGVPANDLRCRAACILREVAPSPA
jgi:hypothetical protein